MSFCAGVDEACGCAASCASWCVCGVGHERRRGAWEALRACGDSLPFAPATREMDAPRELSETELIYIDYFATGVSVSGHR
jgi:hypothetical protein